MNPAARANLIRVVPAMADFLCELDQRIDAGDPDLRVFRDVALDFIGSEPTRTDDEICVALSRLFELPPGFVHFESFRSFLGWDDVPRPAQSMQ